MPNQYTFERRVVYYEETVVFCDSLEEAWVRIDNNDGDEISLTDWFEQYDEEYKLIDEKINDPLVEMIVDYSVPYQFELFDELFVKEIKL